MNWVSGICIIQTGRPHKTIRTVGHPPYRTHTRNRALGQAVRWSGAAKETSCTISMSRFRTYHLHFCINSSLFRARTRDARLGLPNGSSMYRVQCSIHPSLGCFRMYHSWPSTVSQKVPILSTETEEKGAWPMATRCSLHRGSVIRPTARRLRNG